MQNYMDNEVFWHIITMIHKITSLIFEVGPYRVCVDSNKSSMETFLLWCKSVACTLNYMRPVSKR